MSIQRLLNPSSENDKSLNLYGNSVNAKSIDVENIVNESINITKASPVSIFLLMQNPSQPVDQKTYGMYSTVAGNALWFARFSDTGSAIENYLCYKPGTLDVVTNQLNYNNQAAIVNVPTSSLAGSFYENFSSSGNNWTGPFTSPVSSQIIARRVGTNVIVRLGSISAASSNATSMTHTVALPASMRPLINVVAKIQVTDNSSSVVGTVTVSSATGLMTIFVGNGNAFTPAGNAGLEGAFVSYAII